MSTRFQNKKAIIFDLDGTLADTISAITHAVNLTMEYFGYQTKTEDEVRMAVGNGATTLIKRLVPSDVKDDDEHVLTVRKKYDEMYAITFNETTETYEGIVQAVNGLKDQKNLIITVFSNKQDAYVKALSAQLFPNGEILIARGQTELPIKPDPAGVYVILDELSLSSDDCVFVGDSGVDQKTAENSHMDFIGVSWGFWGKERLIESGSKTVIDHPNELLEMIN